MFTHSHRRTAAAAAVALALAALGGCGGDEEPATTTEAPPEATQTQEPAGESAPAGTGELALTAVEAQSGLAFEPAELTAPAGEVTITMDNPDGNQMPHTVAIEGNGVDESGEVVDAGQVAELTAELEAGEYTFYCPVGEHRQNGMEGTLTVE